MIENWKEEFASHILARGKKYFEEGKVSNIIQDGSKITAHVDGTEDYVVEVNLPGGVPDNWLCSCPYAVHGNCKHKAAVLFAIEAGEYIFTGNSTDLKDNNIDEVFSLPWYDAIENLSSNSLRLFLQDFAYNNQKIREHLSIWYMRRLPNGLLNEWKDVLLTYATARAGGHRYVPEDEVNYFISEIRSALDERFILLRNVGAIMDAFYWLGTVFEIIAQKIYIDEPGDFGIFYSDCVDDWSALIEEASNEQQQQMYEWFWKHHNVFFSHAHSATDIEFLYLPWGNDVERKGLELVDKLIANCHNDKELAMLMDCRVEIMDFLDCSYEEVWSFWEQHLSHNYARHRLLENYYSEPEDRIHIVPLLKRLKEIDIDDLPRLIQDSVWLTMMYWEENKSQEYQLERATLLTQYRPMLEQKLPKVLDKQSARNFIACLDALRSLKDDEVNQITEELVEKLCTNPAIARKGIVELVNSAGYEWPKAYRFPQ